MRRVVALTPFRHGGRLVPAGSPVYLPEHAATLFIDSGRASLAEEPAAPIEEAPPQEGALAAPAETVPEAPEEEPAELSKKQHKPKRGKR